MAPCATCSPCEGLNRLQLEQLLERAQGMVRPLGARAAMSQALAGAPSPTSSWSPPRARA